MAPARMAVPSMDRIIGLSPLKIPDSWDISAGRTTVLHGKTGRVGKPVGQVVVVRRQVVVVRRDGRCFVASARIRLRLLRIRRSQLVGGIPSLTLGACMEAGARPVAYARGLYGGGGTSRRLRSGLVWRRGHVPSLTLGACMEAGAHPVAYARGLYAIQAPGVSRGMMDHGQAFDDGSRPSASSRSHSSISGQCWAHVPKSASCR